MVESQENRSDDVAKGGISAMLWRPGVLVPVVLALVGTVAVPKLVRELPELSEYPAYQLSRSAVQVIPEKPDWVPEDFLLSVTGSEKWPEDGTPLLDATLLERVAEAFAEHRWVAEVERVERRVPAGVVVRVAFRRPGAWIEKSRIEISRPSDSAASGWEAPPASLSSNAPRPSSGSGSGSGSGSSRPYFLSSFLSRIPSFSPAAALARAVASCSARVAASLFGCCSAAAGKA